MSFWGTSSHQLTHHGVVIAGVRLRGVPLQYEVRESLHLLGVEPCLGVEGLRLQQRMLQKPLEGLNPPLHGCSTALLFNLLEAEPHFVFNEEI